MFLEVKARTVNEKWIINLNNVAFISPYGESGTRIYLVGDREPIDSEEDYETIKHRIGTYLQIWRTDKVSITSSEGIIDNLEAAKGGAR